MFRQKTEIEMRETPQEQADRLRGALFTLSRLDDIEEMKRIAVAAMAGRLHGHEIKREPVPQSPWADCR